MKDSFLLLSDEGKEGVLLFHQELGGESMSDRGGVGMVRYTEYLRLYHSIALIEIENLEDDTLPNNCT